MISVFLFILLMITPISHTVDTADCDLERDYYDYLNILKDDPVVQAFMDRYPEATGSMGGGISESLPPRAMFPYTYEFDDGVRIALLVDVIDCISPSTPPIYGLTVVENDGSFQGLHRTAIDIDGMIAFIDNYQYKIREDWINVRGDTVSIFPSSVDALFERGYLIEQFFSKD